MVRNKIIIVNCNVVSTLKAKKRNKRHFVFSRARKRARSNIGAFRFFGEAARAVVRREAVGKQGKFAEGISLPRVVVVFVSARNE